MRTTDKLLLGALAGAGLAWGARAFLRSQRRIDLADRVVVITGASTGLGLIAAREAARQGARLVLAARTADELAAAGEEVAQLGPGDVLTVPTDVTDPAQCQHLIQSALDRHGRVDVLLNNAGIIQVGPLETMELADFEQALATNFWGAVHCSLAALPAMRAQGFGRIGNIVSVGGLATVPHLAPYTASKFALTGLTRALRAELAPENILVTGIYPGTMRTGGHAHALVKGDQPAEYALFALSDSLPGFSSSAEAVARAVWRGVCQGDAEVRVGWQSILVPVLSTLAPNLFAEGLALVSRALPGPAGPRPDQAVPGQDIPGKLAGLLTRLVPAAGRPDPQS